MSDFPELPKELTDAEPKDASPPFNNARTMLAELEKANQGFYRENPDEGIYGSFLIVTGGGSIVPVTPMMPGDGDGKDAIAAIMRELMRQLKAVRFAFVSEAWVVGQKLLPGQTKEDIYSSPPPSQRLDRKECVITTVEDKDGTKVQSIVEIVRDGEDGPVLELRPFQHDAEPHGKFEGRFVGLLDADDGFPQVMGGVQ